MQSSSPVTFSSFASLKNIEVIFVVSNKNVAVYSSKSSLVNEASVLKLSLDNSMDTREGFVIFKNRQQNSRSTNNWLPLNWCHPCLISRSTAAYNKSRFCSTALPTGLSPYSPFNFILSNT